VAKNKIIVQTSNFYMMKEPYWEKGCTELFDFTQAKSIFLPFFCKLPFFKGEPRVNAT
jgi:hypothetical protein